jgi:hypothetical protein
VRAATLRAGIQELLNDPAAKGIAKLVLDHGLVQGLDGNQNGPSYIPSSIFATALLDAITPPKDSGCEKTYEDFKRAISNLPNDRTKTALLALADQAAGNLVSYL